MDEKKLENKDEKISNETAHEIMAAMMERQVKRLFILCIIIFIALIGTNAGWIIYESQFVDEVTTIDASQDGGGINIVGGGDVNYGTESENNDQNTP